MAGERAVAESVFELLMFEAFRVAREAPGGDGGEDGASAEARRMEVKGRIEAMGFDVGYRKVERSATEKLLGRHPLELIKFICKDLWLALFQKQADRLQTNHRGMFVLNDGNFTWLKRLGHRTDEKSVAMAEHILDFACGILRGALTNLGLSTAVYAEIKELPGVSFTVKVK
mmetsp:Transcript_2900/g.8378  ORF Transcript_2900/g.8378 Transcript_2900/m.8378 type:complete len:172 (-) Transcript_2900:129-644(-)|eukprot:CAMPEP_0118867392 /NCGR_PEP_ID=MMETSP1163-20130328/11015_1 /TAXON_ID=124430 /ORGANISM="Phaeomonas parva, Strain CCMP2877" /LENGTH=171 /DNA_ID=CAMNT_0006801799 /DNA_START=120 /DNA_END=635 /DNA_ORIENTATION=-